MNSLVRLPDDTLPKKRSREQIQSMETPDKTNEKLGYIVDKQIKGRVNKLPETSKRRQENELVRTPENRIKETAEKNRGTLEKELERIKLNRAKESLEKAKTRDEKSKIQKEKDALRSKDNRAKESVEKAKIRKEKIVSWKTIYHKKNSQEGRGQRLRRQLDKSYENRFEKVDDLECVPNISQYVETNESIKLAYAHLMKTQLGEDEKPIENSCDPCFQFPLLGMCHQANVCVCCDRFITGTSEVKWINKAVLLCHKDRLQDSELSISLQNYYNVLDVELQNCLLSPRARVNVKDDYMCCSQCYHSLRPHMRDKPPPKFSISNKWAIGNMPSELLELLTEVTGPLISPVRPFSFTGRGS